MIPRNSRAVSSISSTDNDDDPGAQLIYRLRKHEISIFIFQERAAESVSLPPKVTRALSFSVESWTQDGLRYFVIGDVGADDIDALCKRLRRSR